MALWMAATESLSSCGPHEKDQSPPPIAHAPKPMGVRSRSELPSFLVSMVTSMLQQGVWMNCLVLSRTGIFNPEIVARIRARMFVLPQLPLGRSRRARKDCAILKLIETTVQTGAVPMKSHSVIFGAILW